MSDEEDDDSQLAIAIDKSIETYTAEQRRGNIPPRSEPIRKQGLLIDQEIAAARLLCRRRTAVSVAVPITKSKSMPAGGVPVTASKSLIEEQNEAYALAEAVDTSKELERASLETERASRESLLQKMLAIRLDDIPFGDDTVKLGVRLPSGNRVVKVFRKTDTLGNVRIFVAQLIHKETPVLPDEITLSIGSGNLSLADAGVTGNTLFNYTIHKKD